MTEERFDRLLRTALMEAVWQDFQPVIEAAEHEQVTYSKRYLKRRERLLEDPFGYAKKMLRTPLQRVARTAAMILLVCSILFAMAMAVPEVRAALKRLYMEWYETHVAVYVQEPFGGDVTDLSVFHVEIPEEVLPEGYREIVRDEYAGVVVYSDELGNTISLDYRSAGKKHEVGTNNEGMIVQREVVKGIEYYQFKATGEAWASQIMWIDEEFNLIFGIDASKNFGVEELIFFAQNISVVKK